MSLTIAFEPVGVKLSLGMLSPVLVEVLLSSNFCIVIFSKSVGNAHLEMFFGHVVASAVSCVNPLPGFCGHPSVPTPFTFQYVTITLGLLLNTGSEATYSISPCVNELSNSIIGFATTVYIGSVVAIPSSSTLDTAHLYQPSDGSLLLLL